MGRLLIRCLQDELLCPAYVAFTLLIKQVTDNSPRCVLKAALQTLCSTAGFSQSVC